MRYRYGVFSEVGFPNDPMYPAYYSVGPETRKNEGCNTTFLVNEEKYQKVSSNSSNNSGRSNIAISRQMVSLCLLIVITVISLEQSSIVEFIGELARPNAYESSQKSIFRDQ